MIYLIVLTKQITCDISRIDRNLTLNNKKVTLHTGSFKHYPNYKVVTNSTVEIQTQNRTMCGWAVLTKTTNISHKYTFVEQEERFVGFSFKKQAESNGLHRCILQDILCELKPFTCDAQWDYFQMYQVSFDAG